MVGRHHIFFGNSALALAGFPSGATTAYLNANMAREGYEIDSHHPLFIDASNPSGRLAYELCQRIHSELFWFV